MAGLRTVFARSREQAPGRKKKTMPNGEHRIVHGCGCQEKAHGGWGRQAIVVCADHQAVPR